MIRNRVTNNLIRFGGTHFRALLKRQISGEAKYFLKKDIVKHHKLVKGGNTDPSVCELCNQDHGEAYEEIITKYADDGTPYQETIRGNTNVVQTEPCGHYTCVLCIQKWNTVSKEHLNSIRNEVQSQVLKKIKKKGLLCPWCKKKISGPKASGIFAPLGTQPKNKSSAQTNVIETYINKEIENIRKSVASKKSFIFYETIKIQLTVMPTWFLTNVSDPNDIKEIEYASSYINTASGAIAKLFMITDDTFQKEFTNKKDKYDVIWIDGCIVRLVKTHSEEDSEYVFDIQIVLASTSKHYQSGNRKSIVNMIKNGTDLSNAVIRSTQTILKNTKNPFDNFYKMQTIDIRDKSIPICIYTYKYAESGLRWTSEQKLNMDEYKRTYLLDPIKDPQRNIVFHFYNQITYKVGYWKNLLDEIDDKYDTNYKTTKETVAADALLELNNMLDRTRIGNNASTSGYAISEKSA